MFAMSIIMSSGMPMLKKSEKRYPPGPYTSIWVGDPIGAAYPDDTATISATQKVSGFTFRVTAVWYAIGKKIAAVAVLLANSVRNTATVHTPMRAM
jgi:hypothetical protein